MVVYQAHVEVACSLLRCFSHQRLFYVPRSQRKAPCTYTTLRCYFTDRLLQALTEREQPMFPFNTVVIPPKTRKGVCRQAAALSFSVWVSHALSHNAPGRAVPLCNAPVRRLSSLWSQLLQKACLPQTPACNKLHTAQRPHF